MKTRAARLKDREPLALADGANKNEGGDAITLSSRRTDRRPEESIFLGRPVGQCGLPVAPSYLRKRHVVLELLLLLMLPPTSC